MAYGNYERAIAEAIVDQMILRGIATVLSSTSSTSDHESLYSQVQAAPDLIKTFTYADAGTVDERIISIISRSTQLGATFTDTYLYQGSSGAYRVSEILRSYGL